MSFLAANAGDLAQKLSVGEFTPLELLEEAIAEIEKRDPAINAFAVKDYERARIAARAAADERERGERRPLLGVPISVKESFHVAGLRTTWGLPAFREWQPRVDSLAIHRLKQAGAVILGKTNLSAGCADWQCDNALFGRTNNPWDLTRTPGGSSGGSAAAIAAGFSALEIGSDVAGSIRIPAAFCGVFGHRPTYGILSADGYGFPGTFALSDLSTIGPLARCANDLMIALDVLSGPSSADSVAWHVTLPAARRQRLADYKILVLTEHPLVPTQYEVRENILNLATELRHAGALVANTSPLLPDIAEAARICLRLLVPMTLSRTSDEQWDSINKYIAQLSPQDTSLSAIGLRAGAGTHRSWLRANEQRARLSLQWQRFFSEWDLLLAPVAPTAAFPHLPHASAGTTLDIDGQQIPYADQMTWASLPTACGLPATAIPFGSTAAGLPLAFQAIGPYGEDRTPITFAAHLEEHFGALVRFPS